MNMKILAVIPARGGSKRLPRKNVTLLDDLPLIAWTLRAANQSGVFHDVIVSTDSEEIAATTLGYGGKAPWLRPADLAQDTSTVVDVLLHAVQTWERDSGAPVDGVCLLQPTSPFRRPETLRMAVDQFAAGGGKSVIGVSPPPTHPQWCMSVTSSGFLEPLNPDGLQLRSQDLPPTYAVNGVLYIVSRNYLLAERDLYTKPMLPAIVTDPVEALDIDTPFDWAVAERFAPQINGGFK